MIHVFLDDQRKCPPGFVLARSAEECLLLLKECEVGVLSLDYDLGYGVPDGMDVVNEIIVSGKYPQEIYIHSSSWMGRARMARALKESAPPSVLVSDEPMPDEVLKRVASCAAKNDGK